VSNIRSPDYPAIPDPQPNLASLHNTVLALKEAVELLTGQRGNRAVSVVTYRQMVVWGKITAQDIPR